MSEWFRCKICHKPLLKITEQSVVINEIYCRNCRKSFDVIISDGKVIKNEEIKKSN